MKNEIFDTKKINQSYQKKNVITTQRIKFSTFETVTLLIFCFQKPY